MNVKKIEKKSVLRFASIIVGIILWIVIIYTENGDFETKLTGVDVQITGENILLSNNLVLVNKDEIKKGAVSVKGKRGDVIQSMGNVTASADVAHIKEPGIYDVKVSYEMNSSALYITKSRVSTVEVVVESTTLKEFEVEIVQQGNNENEDIIIESITDMPKISVEGAVEDIDKIKHVIVNVDISNMKTDNVSEYHIILVDDQYNEIQFKNNIYKSEEHIKINNLVHKKAILPIEVEFTKEEKEKYVFETEWISKKDVMVGLDEEVELETLKVSIEDNEYSSESKEYTAKWQDLTGVYMPDKEDVKVKIKAYPIISKEITIPLEVEANENQKYTTDKTVTVKVYGAECYMNEDNIKAKINITELGKGKHTFEVKMEFAKEGLWVKEDKYVKVEIEK